MRCGEFERRLHGLLDEHPEGSRCLSRLPSALEAHASECDACSGQLRGYRQLFAGLSAIPPSNPSTQFVDRIVAESLSLRSRVNLYRWFAHLATAASVLIVLSLAAVARNRSSQPVAQTLPAIPVRHGAVRSVPRHAESFFSASSESFLPIRSRLELDHASVGVVLNLAGLSPVTFSAEVLEAHLAQQPAWMVELADGLRPVTESMTGTLNALLRVLPGNTEAAEQDHGARHERHSRYDRLA